MERDAPLLNGRDPHADVNHAALQGFLAGVVGRSRRMAGGSGSGGRLDLVTGAWSYLGGHVAAELLDRGRRVRTLTSRPVPAPDPFAGAVEARAWNWDDPVRLREALKGVDTLYNTYWTRHTRPPVGHRGPWTSHDAAVGRSALLFAAAAEAGVRRVVHVGITLPPDPQSAAELSAAGPEAARASSRAWRAASELPYFRGKQLVELSLQGVGASHGLSHAVLRPSCFFGRGRHPGQQHRLRRPPLPPVSAAPAPGLPHPPHPRPGHGPGHVRLRGRDGQTSCATPAAPNSTPSTIW